MGFRYGFTMRGADAGGIVKVFELWIFIFEMGFLELLRSGRKAPFLDTQTFHITKNNGQQDL